MSRDPSYPRIRQRPLLLTAVLVLVLIGAVVWVIAHFTRDPPPPTIVHLATVKAAHSSTILLAERLGYFRDLGIDVRLEYHDSGSAALATLAQPGLRLATCADVALGVALARGSDFHMLASLTSIVDLNVLAYRLDRNITGIADLKGKVIGVIPETTSEYYLDVMLDLHDLDRADLTVTGMSVVELDQAILDGRVDAASLWSPHYEQVRSALPERIAIFGNEGLYHWSWMLTAQRTDPAAREVFTRVLRALIRAGTELSRNRDAHSTTVAEWVGLSPQTILGLWSWCTFDCQLNQSVLLQLENATNWQISRETGTHARGSVDTLSHIDPIPLRMADPVRMRLIHPLAP